MFTVSHHKNGTEHFHEAEAVVYHGPFAAMQQADGYAVEIVRSTETYLIYGGQVYVMNDAGATVAKYDLGIDNAKSAGVLKAA